MSRWPSRATGQTVLAGLAGQAAVLVSGVTAARVLGAEDREHLALVALVPFLVFQIGSGGLPLATTYFVAKEPDDAVGIARRLKRPALIQAAVLTVIHGAILAAVLGGSDREVVIASLISLAASPALLLQSYGVSMLQGLQEFSHFNIWRLSAPIIYAVLVFALALASYGTLVPLTAAWVASYVISAGGAIVATRVLVGRSRPVRSSGPEIRQMLSFGLRGLLGSSSPLETYRPDQAVVGVFLSPSALGLYVAANAFTNLPRFIAQSVGMVAYPETAGAQERAHALSLARRFVLLSASITGGIAAALIVLAEPLMQLLFGDEFVGATAAMRILVVAAWLFGVRRVMSDVARGLGRPGVGTTAEVVSWITFVPSVAVLAYLDGIEGVSLAVAGSALASLLALLLLLRVGVRRLRPTTTVTVAVALTVIAAAVGVGLEELTSSSSDAATAAAAIVALAVALGPAAVRIARREFDIFEPVVFAGLMLAILFGARPLAMLASGEITYEDGFYVTAGFGRAVGVGLVATIAFVLGYESMARGPSGGGARVAHPPVDWSRFRTFAAGATCLGVGLFLVHLSVGGSIVASFRLLMQGRSNAVSDLYSSSSEYLSSAPILLSCVAIVIIVLSDGRPSRRLAIHASLLTAAPVLLFLLIGNRRFIIPALVLPIILLYFMRGRRPSARLLLIALPILFIVLATVPYARSEGAREQAGGALSIYQRAVSAPGKVAHTFILGHDTAMIPGLAIEIETLDRTGDYSYGKATVGDFLLAPIPSAIFPGKPQTARDGLLIDAVGRPCEVRAGGSCPDFSVAGTFYQEGKYIGLVLGMLLFGGAAGAVWRRFKINASSREWTVVAACVTVFLPVLIRAGFMPAFAWSLYFAVPSLIGLRYAQPLARARPHSGRGHFEAEGSTR